GDVLVFVSPERPVRGQPVRFVAITDREVDAQLTVTPDAPKADAAAASAWATHDRAPGPPYSWFAHVDTPSACKCPGTLTRDAAVRGGASATREVVVAASGGGGLPTPRTALWLTRAAWTPGFENLYSAWIEHMFDDPPETQRSWNALHEVLRD